MTEAPKHRRSVLREFLAQEAAGGVVLIAAAAAALIIANSPLAETYFHALHLEIGPLSALHWINDALMAAFFLLVGLELKREFLVGQLARWGDRALPGLCALAGMVVPALIYIAINRDHGEALRGWAIPAATDIAFALGVISLLGSRAPASLKVFLTALAILDDLGAVLIIALFYTAQLLLVDLGLAALVCVGLFALGRFKVRALWPYLALGVLLWVFVHRSGVHASLSGVALALAIPLTERSDDESSPLERLEHGLSPWVAFAIVPIFGFANAGVSLAGVTPSALLDTIPLGVAAGLFLGKQLGVFAAAWFAIKSGIAQMPAHANWRQLYGVALLCGIGFTMSLFIGLLAFDAAALQDEVKIGVLAGSLLSALAGFALLRLQPQPIAHGRDAAEN